MYTSPEENISHVTEPVAVQDEDKRVDNKSRRVRIAMREIVYVKRLERLKESPVHTQ
jgi:hypothetical protein